MAAGTILSHFSGAAVPFWWCSQVRVEKMVFYSVHNSAPTPLLQHTRHKHNTIMYTIRYSVVHTAHRPPLPTHSVASFSSRLITLSQSLFLSIFISTLSLPMSPHPTPPKSLRWSLHPLKLLYFNFGRAYFFNPLQAKSIFQSSCWDGLLLIDHTISSKRDVLWSGLSSLAVGWEVKQERTTLFKPWDSSLLNTIAHILNFF